MPQECLSLHPRLGSSSLGWFFVSDENESTKLEAKTGPSQKAVSGKEVRIRKVVPGKEVRIRAPLQRCQPEPAG
jgi:hypothetical protein